MAIILEGPDAAGKTTLGRQLANQFGMRLVVSGGAPHNPQEVMEYCDMQLEACKDRTAIIDRITPISHPIYNPAYRTPTQPRSELLQKYLDDMISREDVVIVYCRPPVEALMRPEKHVWKDYDTEEHKKKVLNNQMVFIGLYDEAFLKIPHLSYDYTLREEEYTVELISMLAASVQCNLHMAELKRLQRTVNYAY